jgi:hypothetical protein
MIPFIPEEQVRESIPAGEDERGGRKPTHPALIPWACTRLPKATSVLFCPPPSGSLQIGKPADEPAEMGRGDGC